MDLLGKYGWYGRAVLPFNWWFMIISPWLTVLIGVLATATVTNLFGLAGLLVPVVTILVFFLGQREQLGLLQPLYVVADAQVSLLIAQVRLVLTDATGVWEVDRDSRRVFE